uniref:Seizure related 6 homolog like n=1 Tax=Sinocyclocheilus grahami TaxID=75366 RepID=A0A672RCD5_SINGR
MQVPAPKETPRGVASMGQDFIESVLSRKDHLLAQKGVTLPSGLPPNLVPMLGKGLGARAEALSPDQPLLRKMLPSHSASLPPAYELPTEPPEAVATRMLGFLMSSVWHFPPAVTNCRVNFSDPEGYIDSSDDPPLPEGAFLQCTYTVTVYTGYGVELQYFIFIYYYVFNISNNIIFRLSCALPRRPHFGEVSVKDLHPGGTAHFQCHMGYHLQGDATLMCLNASLPVWSQHEPSCRALCGGVVKNVTVGRVLSPSPHSGPNSTLDRSCSWSLEAPNGQRLHLHLERMVLGPTDRLVLWSGLDAGSVVLFDSGHGGPIPFEGVISEGPAVRVQFITDQPNSHNTGFNIRYEAFEKGHCYEPYIQNGNFSTTDPTYGVGTVVQFTCDPGHSLEQGPPVIECINTRDPYWNDTEPLCKALCGGDLSGPSGVILSPNWPEWYGEGEDCSWRIHVGEDKRVLLDVQLLNLSDSDMLTILDGDEVTTRILGQFVGGTSPFKMSSSTPDLTITFHSDPAGLVFGKGEGFIINYMEVSRNDSCPDLPEIQNGWKTTSHAALVRGARITYQCDPGYDLVGSETLTCQVDLSWNTQPPFCEKTEESVSCENPGLPDNGYQILSKRLYLPGESLTFMCYQGYELIGEMAIKCILGNPSFWSGPLPLCRANHECSSNHALEVAEAAADSSFDGGSMALAIFILVLLVSVLLGGTYIYVTRCRYHSNLRLPLMYPHPYSQITVETEFDNPLYETGGDTREYEVSI